MIVERRCGYQPKNDRNILFVHPSYNRSFGTFYHMYQFFPDVRGFMAPLGILIVANYLPKRWHVRFVDENARPLTDEDIDWADVVFVSGMHIQRPVMQRINERCHARGKMTVLGGCSVSAAPDDYPDFDVIHCGELGDATDKVVELVDKTPVGERPAKQVKFVTEEKIPIDEFPLPAYHLIDMNTYLVATIQFSSGCPFTCEFCDIPMLYGRNPRIVPTEKILAALDVLKASGYVGGVYFVDDNFIGNQKACKAFLPELADWQKRNGYPFRFGIEATINLAQNEELLELMRQAYVTDCYFGIESPEEDTLEAISKKQNIRVPILDALEKVRSYGIEAHAGVILGFDSDSDRTKDFILKFIDESHCPLIAVNMLFALPMTPLWDRLTKEGRLLPYEQAQHTNVKFLRDNDKVLEEWRECSRAAYEPHALYRRYLYQIEHCYPNRLPLALSRYDPSWDRLKMLVYTLGKLFWVVGVRSDYRRSFWKLASRTLPKGQLEATIHNAAMAHHLIEFGKDCERNALHASHYTKA